jgi:hypothetical protein
MKWLKVLMLRHKIRRIERALQKVQPENPATGNLITILIGLRGELNELERGDK